MTLLFLTVFYLVDEILPERPQRHTHYCLSVPESKVLTIISCTNTAAVNARGHAGHTPLHMAVSGVCMQVNYIIL